MAPGPGAALSPSVAFDRVAETAESGKFIEYDIPQEIATFAASAYAQRHQALFASPMSPYNLLYIRGITDILFVVAFDFIDVST